MARPRNRRQAQEMGKTWEGNAAPMGMAEGGFSDPYEAAKQARMGGGGGFTGAGWGGMPKMMPGGMGGGNAAQAGMLNMGPLMASMGANPMKQAGMMNAPMGMAGGGGGFTNMPQPAMRSTVRRPPMGGGGAPMARSGWGGV